MKKKIKLTIAFLVSLLPMLLNQYGGKKGVQEISGLINLLNPIGIISVLLFIIRCIRNNWDCNFRNISIFYLAHNEYNWKNEYS